MKVKQESEKTGLQNNNNKKKKWLTTQHSKTKIMASGPIFSWHVDGETMETVRDFTFLAPKSLQIIAAA